MSSTFIWDSFFAQKPTRTKTAPFFL